MPNVAQGLLLAHFSGIISPGTQGKRIYLGRLHTMLIS